MLHSTRLPERSAVNCSLILTRNACNSLFWLFGVGLGTGVSRGGLLRLRLQLLRALLEFHLRRCRDVRIPRDQLNHQPPLHFLGRHDPWFWVRFSLAVISTLAALASAGYVRRYAVHLETTQPFFGRFDFNVGLVFLCPILALNWFHWGGLFTIIIAGSVVYFFLAISFPIRFSRHRNMTPNSS